MEDYTIAESYELPSKGLVYDKPVNPKIKIRSMTTEEEMKRLGHSERPNSLLAEIIDECLVEKPGISAYDLCIPDYQFLMYKLRIVTYGSKYTFSSICPICGKPSEYTIDLEELPIKLYSEDLRSHLNITLPKTGKQIELRLQTPRILDDVAKKSKDLLSKSSDIKGEPAFLFNLISMINKVDGQVIDEFKLENFVRKLPMADTNFILNNIKEVNFGLNTEINCTCKHCQADYKSYLPITGEFFGPTFR